MSSRFLYYHGIAMLKSMSVYNDFQALYLISWQHSRQPIRIHVRKPLVFDMDFNLAFIYSKQTTQTTSAWSSLPIVKVS